MFVSLKILASRLSKDTKERITMTGLYERRKNWKEEMAEEARISKERQALKDELSKVMEEIANVGVNWDRYDELQKQKREIVAKIATL
jgi:hypothetical protein